MRLMATALMMIASLSFAWAQDAPKLMNPAQLTETAPDKYQVKFDTSKGEFIVEVTRAWAPNGADRFYNLVKNGFYDDCRFFRAIDGFMVQFGINGDPKISKVWRGANIKDDPVKQSNKRGFITFAMSSAPNSRTTQVFINYNDRNAQLDSPGFAPFGKVIKGMNIVDSLYTGYGEGAPSGKGPDQGMVQTQIRIQGNDYLAKNFPNLDYIKTASLVSAQIT